MSLGWWDPLQHFDGCWRQAVCYGYLSTGRVVKWDQSEGKGVGDKLKKDEEKREQKHSWRAIQVPSDSIGSCKCSP